MSTLSSNWKKLQAVLKGDSPAAPKRKADDDGKGGSGTKKQKQGPGDGYKRPIKVPKLTKKSNSPKLKKPASGAISSPSPMGNTQSSKIDPIPPERGVAPSLAVWAAGQSVTSETIAEAYNLGLKIDDTPVRVNEGLAPGLELGKYVAVDCEMVGVGDQGRVDSLARVSAVDFLGKQVYDSYVLQREKVVNWRTEVSGVAPRHMKEARPFEEVQAQMMEVLRQRVLIGHDVQHDLLALEIKHIDSMIRDTSRHRPFQKYAWGLRPSLRVLAQELLGIEIQKGEHSSLEDARVAMLLFRTHKMAFDMEHLRRFPQSKKKSNQKDKKSPKTTRRLSEAETKKGIKAKAKARTKAKKSKGKKR